MADGKPRIAVWIGAAVVAAGAVAAVLAISGGGGSRTSGAGASADAERSEAAGSASSAGTGSTSGAGSGSPAGAETASGLLEAARAEAAAGHYVQALGRFQRAYALDGAPSTLLEVGRMQHLSGRCREARRTTQRVLAASPPADIAGAAQDLLVRIGRCD